MNKYEYEKQIAQQMPALDNHGFLIAEETMNSFLRDEKNRNAKFLMLLCNELNYYTIFHLSNNVLRINLPMVSILNFLKDDPFLKSLGDIKYIDNNEDHIEIWIGEYYFALFVADTFVVNI